MFPWVTQKTTAELEALLANYRKTHDEWPSPILGSLDRRRFPGQGYTDNTSMRMLLTAQTEIMLELRKRGIENP